MIHDHLPVITSQLLESTSLVGFAFSTRQGGASDQPFGMNTSLNVGDVPERVYENRRRLLERIGRTPEQLALPGQVHGDIVLKAEAPGNFPNCDALITNRPGLVLGISAADCVPVFMVDTECRAIAAVHAGWRGTANHIAVRALEMLTREYRSQPGNIVAFIGPRASVCCYEVGEDVASLFHPSALVREDGMTHVDLKKENVRQLISAGLLHANIEVSPLCTISEQHLLHSHRRDREQSGRMMGVIVLL